MSVNNKISMQPYKGSKDYYPDDYAVLDYIFNVWASVCKKYGYKQYQSPMLEMADLYRAKSGEDVGNKELFTLQDSAGRDLAIRPEMTPSVTRMVAKTYKEANKPIRLFSISNFLRNERPQKGRNREFWQLNADIFGEESISADIEILSLAIDLMLAFNPPEGAFVLNYNSRKLIEDFLNNCLNLSDAMQKELVRSMDKYAKFEDDEKFVKYLLDKGFEEETIEKTLLYLNSNATTLSENFPELDNFEGVKEITYIQEALSTLGYEKYTSFKPNVIRGLDYYDGLIFEVFDTNKENPRSLFGGGRYNGLADIFGEESFPAVGFAPGNETLRIFLENWDLVPELNMNQELYYFPLLENVPISEQLRVINILRTRGYAIVTGFQEQNVTQSLREADKQSYGYVILMGSEELAKEIVAVKDMKNGNQTDLTI